MSHVLAEPSAEQLHDMLAKKHAVGLDPFIHSVPIYPPVKIGIWNINPWISIYIYISGWWYTYPSEKYEFVSWDDEIPKIWENKTCSKPPTIYMYIYIICVCVCVSIAMLLYW